MKISVDTKLLKKQIIDLLKSNIQENSKSGLHNLLGEIFDNLKNKKEILLSKN